MHMHVLFHFTFNFYQIYYMQQIFVARLQRQETEVLDTSFRIQGLWYSLRLAIYGLDLSFDNV